MIWWTTILLIALPVCAICLGLVLHWTYGVHVFFEPPLSMDPMLQPGDWIMVTKSSCDLDCVHRGDIVVSRRPQLVHQNFADIANRVASLPGDSVAF